MRAKWICFVEIPNSPERKTKVWQVVAKQNGMGVGVIRWFTSWRCYTFLPDSTTIFEEDCLRDIAEFVESETRKHREANKAAKAAKGAE